MTEEQGYTPEIIETGAVADTPSPIAEDAVRNAIGEDEPSASIDEALEKAFAKSQEKEDAKPEPKKAEKAEAPKEEPEAKEAEEEKKPKARAADGKFAPAEAEGKADAPKAENLQSEGKRINAPARLLPSERDVWVNTPRAVQGAFERIEREYESKLAEREESAKFHTELKEFDDLAKKSGTTIKAALANFVNAENAIRQDFGRGITQLAQSMGKNPTQAVAEFMRAANVTPQQLGAYLQGQPAQAPQQQQQRPVDPTAQAALQRVQQLEQQLAKQSEEAQRVAELQRVEQEIIGPAKAEMPRFDELQDEIVKLLKTGYIDTSLSPDVRLREAYFAADRMRPALRSQPELEADPDMDSKVTTLPRKKQISGSATSSTAKTVKKGPAPSIDEALERALRQVTR